MNHITISLGCCFLFLLMNCTFLSKENAFTETTLRVGIIPYKKAIQLRKQYAPLCDYFESALNLKCELVFPHSYDKLHQLFHDKKLDLVYFGGMTFVQSFLKDNAIPIAISNRSIHTTSYFISLKKKGTANNIHLFKDQRLIFGHRFSTSGHIMPWQHFVQNDILPEKFFSSVSYGSTPVEVMEALRSNKADIGVVHKVSYERYVKKQAADRELFTILDETLPFPNTVWAIHPTVSPPLRKALKKAFTQLNHKDTASIQVLESLGVDGFLLANSDLYRGLIKIVSNLGLLSDPIQKSSGTLILRIHPFLPIGDVIRRFKPLASYLSTRLRRQIEVKVSKSYQDHIELVGEGNYDIAYLGPVPYIKVVEKYGPQQLLTRLAINKAPFMKGVFFTRRGSIIKDLEGLRGKNIALGYPSSTLSNIVPRYMLEQVNLNCNKSISCYNIGNHADVVLSVLAGENDAGAVKEEVFNKYKSRGLKAITFTPLISEHLFVINPKQKKQYYGKVQNALFNLSKSSKGKNILKAIKPGASALVKVADQDYDNLRLILEELKSHENR